MPVDLKQLVHAIVPSPFSPPWLPSRLARTQKRYDLDLPIGEFELAEPFFWGQKLVRITHCGSGAAIRPLAVGGA